MIRLGVCAQASQIDLLAQIGYDYIELNLSATAALSDAEFDAVRAQVEAAPIKAEAFNVMLPGTLRVTGPDVNASELHAYLDRAMGRAKALGGQVIVFGSAGARNVPDNWPIDRAWRQIANYLRIVERHATDHEIRIAIEPLRRQESNIINLVSEATALSSILQLKHIGVLGDTYHMAMGAEPFSTLTLAGDLLWHVHVANPIGRVYPKANDGEDYEALFQALRAGGYSHRVSVEGGTEAFEQDARDAYHVLDEARRTK